MSGTAIASETANRSKREKKRFSPIRLEQLIPALTRALKTARWPSRVAVNFAIDFARSLLFSFAPVHKFLSLMPHPLYERACALTGQVIASAIEVHKHFGPGLIESVYEWALIRELQLRGIDCLTQQSVEIRYKGVSRTIDFRYDVLVEGCLLVEVKAIEGILPVHKAQLISYLKLNIPLGFF